MSAGPDKQGDSLFALVGRWFCRHGRHAWAYPFRPVGEHGYDAFCVRCSATKGER